eukprot:SAG25_NODE_13210_length_270_cov_0.602339_1_plen_24_part_01
MGAAAPLHAFDSNPADSSFERFYC